MNSPILLSASVAISPNQILEPDTSKLQNPFKTAMYLDEIRFRVPLIVTTGNDQYNPFLSIRCDLKMGRMPMTNGFIPIGGMCRRTHEGNDTIYDIIGTASIWHTFKLPKPLYVPRGEFVIPRLQYDSRYGGTSEMTVYVSYAGRSLPADYPVPPTTQMPWVANFDIPRLQYVSGNSDSTISTQAQLVNPFDQPLFVQRFIGRTLRQSAQTIVGNASTELGAFDGDQAPATMTFVRAVDSFGNILVRDPTPFTHLFQYLDRSWTVNSVLSPKGFYIFQVDRTYTATDTSEYFSHCISMIGHRTVELR